MKTKLKALITLTTIGLMALSNFSIAQNNDLASDKMKNPDEMKMKDDKMIK